jgi:hypothetical protein
MDENQAKVIARGQQAQELQNNQYLTDVLESLKRESLRMIVDSKMPSVDEREYGYRMYRTVMRFIQIVDTAAVEGEHTVAQLKYPHPEDVDDGYPE